MDTLHKGDDDDDDDDNSNNNNNNNNNNSAVRLTTGPSASSRASSPYSAIQRLLFQFPVSSLFLMVVQ